MIPYGHQEITQSDIDAVVEVLRSECVTQGPTIPQFERATTDTVGADYGVAVSSATAALHIGCLALDLGPGDLLWTSPNTYVASANCARYCGASVDFVDIDPDTWNICELALHEKLKEADRAGRLPKVLIPVHFAGQPTVQDAIWELAQRYGFKVLEDASHSIGASRNGETVGSCNWSDITVFSFHPVKIITTGEGGMALTNSADLAEKMRLYRAHGVTRDASRFRNDHSATANGSSDERSWPGWYYEQQVLGYNYRMSDIHAALGISQLKRLGGYVERRNALAARYDAALRELPIRLPRTLSANRSAFHIYVVRVNQSSQHNHGYVFHELRRRGIGVNLHYMPVHLQPYYRELGFSPGQYPEAEAHGREAITLPLYPAMSHQEQDEVVEALYSILA